MKNVQKSANFHGENVIWAKHLQKQDPDDDFTHEFSMLATCRADYTIGEDRNPWSLAHIWAGIRYHNPPPGGGG